jgi:hypothetical protein
LGIVIVYCLAIDAEPIEIYLNPFRYLVPYFVCFAAVHVSRLKGLCHELNNFFEALL